MNTLSINYNKLIMQNSSFNSKKAMEQIDPQPFFHYFIVKPAPLFQPKLLLFSRLLS